MGFGPLILVAGLLRAAPAGAAEFHPFEYEIDGTGTTAGQFARIEDVAVHQSTGTIYVFDKNHHSIDKFDAAGTRRTSRPPARRSIDVYRGLPGVLLLPIWLGRNRRRQLGDRE